MRSKPQKRTFSVGVAMVTARYRPDGEMAVFETWLSLPAKELLSNQGRLLQANADVATAMREAMEWIESLVSLENAHT